VLPILVVGVGAVMESGAAHPAQGFSASALWTLGQAPCCWALHTLDASNTPSPLGYPEMSPAHTLLRTTDLEFTNVGNKPASCCT
jgi:hypothetical protein